MLDQQVRLVCVYSASRSYWQVLYQQVMLVWVMPIGHTGRCGIGTVVVVPGGGGGGGQSGRGITSNSGGSMRGGGNRYGLGFMVPCPRCSIVRETAGGRSAGRGAHLLQGRGKAKGRGAKDGRKGGARDHVLGGSADEHPAVPAGGARHLGDSPEVDKGVAGRRPRCDPETGPHEVGEMGVHGHA